MKKVFFDTETTGFKPGQIGQIAYIIENEDGSLKTGNHYFEVEYVTRGAQEATGRDAEYYKEASEGRKFGEDAEVIANEFSNATLIAHNVTFDLNFLNMELYRAGKQLTGSNKFDTMTYFRDICKIVNPRNSGRYKDPKLMELVDHFSVDRSKIKEYCSQLFGVENESFHGAAYDTTAMFLAFKIYEEQTKGTGTTWKDRFCKQ